jgi:hypothetical protein
MDSTKEVIQYMDIAGNMVPVDLTTLPTTKCESLDCSGNKGPSSSCLLSSLPSLNSVGGVRLRSGRVLESKVRDPPALQPQSEPATR